MSFLEGMFGFKTELFGIACPKLQSHLTKAFMHNLFVASHVHFDLVLDLKRLLHSASPTLGYPCWHCETGLEGHVSAEITQKSKDAKTKQLRTNIPN